MGVYIGGKAKEEELEAGGSGAPSSSPGSATVLGESPHRRGQRAVHPSVTWYQTPSLPERW